MDIYMIFPGRFHTGGGEAREGHSLLFVIDDIHAVSSETDFVHFVASLEGPGNEEFITGLSNPDNLNSEVYRLLSYKELIEKGEKIAPVDLTKPGVAHYWGIKTRVQHNYFLLLATLKELGVDTSVMPKWGDRNGI